MECILVDLLRFLKPSEPPLAQSKSQVRWHCVSLKGTWKFAANLRLRTSLLTPTNSVTVAVCMTISSSAASALPKNSKTGWMPAILKGRPQIAIGKKQGTLLQIYHMCEIRMHMINSQRPTELMCNAPHIPVIHVHSPRPKAQPSSSAILDVDGS